MSDTENTLSFEDAMNRLEELVRKMEEGNVPLEEMIRRYEEARGLAAFCQKTLTGMKEKIEMLTKDNGADGEWRDLAPAETTPDRTAFLPGENK